VRPVESKAAPHSATAWRSRCARSHRLPVQPWVGAGSQRIHTGLTIRPHSQLASIAVPGSCLQLLDRDLDPQCASPLETKSKVNP
jgi:hypothetical protein